MPESLRQLIEHISMLPGIGENRATKLAFFLLSANSNYVNSLSESLQHIKGNIGTCSQCHSVTDAGKDICDICSSPRRSKTQICVVEEYLDLLTLEQSGGYNGSYHVLGGAISPINGIFVGDLNFSTLFEKIEHSEEKLEIILATNPNLEGEATASFIKEEIEKRKIRHKVVLTKLSRGLSSGYIEYADSLSLVSAMKERKEI